MVEMARSRSGLCHPVTLRDRNVQICTLPSPPYKIVHNLNQPDVGRNYLKMKIFMEICFNLTQKHRNCMKVAQSRSARSHPVTLSQILYWEMQRTRSGHI